MKLEYFFFSVLMAIVFLSGCTNTFNKSSADWAFGFVVWDGYIYQLSHEVFGFRGNVLWELLQ